MKRFKLLVFLLVGLISFTSFGYCDDVEDLLVKLCSDGSSDCEDSFSNVSVGTTYGTLFVHNASSFDTYCVSIKSNQGGADEFHISAAGQTINQNPYTNYIYWNSYLGHYFCFPNNSYQLTIKADRSTVIAGDLFRLDSLLATALPIMTSSQCQQEYSLMPISSCDSEYCSANGFCSDNILSELYINGINHVSAPIINITIPEDIAWDYALTGDNFNLVVSGTTVDYEYMDNIIRTQNSKPSTTDLNNIVSVLLPKFVPGLVILLFILFIFRFLKKIF